MNADAAASWLEQALAAEQPKDALRMAEKAQSMCSTSRRGTFGVACAKSRILAAGATHYQVLEVPRSTPIGETQAFTSAYKRVIRVVHPDRCQAPGAAAAAARINEANDTLSDVQAASVRPAAARDGGRRPRRLVPAAAAAAAAACSAGVGQGSAAGAAQSLRAFRRCRRGPFRRRDAARYRWRRLGRRRRRRGGWRRVVEEERESVPSPPPCLNSMCSSDRKELKKIRAENAELKAAAVELKERVTRPRPRGPPAAPAPPRPHPRNRPRPAGVGSGLGDGRRGEAASGRALRRCPKTKRERTEGDAEEEVEAVEMEEEEPEEVVEEAEGMTLHLSSNNATGYTGVYVNGKSFTAKYHGEYLGKFATPVEAAVAYARHFDAQQQQQAKEEDENEDDDDEEGAR